MVLKLLVVASGVLFYRGLILVGKLFQNYLLKISGLLMLILCVVFYLTDIVALYTEIMDYTYILVTESICFGLVGILFGIALLRLKAPLKSLGLVAGILEIMAGATFLTIILALIGVFAWSAALIVEIILLYRVVDLLKIKMKEFS